MTRPPMSKPSRQASKQVFISVQRQCDSRQESFLTGIHTLLQRQHLGWLMLNRDEERAQLDPLPGIRDALLSCQGALVIAFERWQSGATIEYPRAPYAIGHGVRRLPTVWNQIEAAMAFQAGLPVLVLVETGLHQQGMTSPRRTSIQVASFTLGTANQRPDAATAALVEAWCRHLSTPAPDLPSRP